jgi:homeodomain-containing protein
VLVELTMMEQRNRAVIEARAGVPVTEVAERFGVSRQAVHRWIHWYEDEGLDGLTDRSHRPHAYPERTSPEVEAAICELRRTHPRRGQRRIEFELGRTGHPGPIPSVSTIYRVLVRHGLVDAVPRGLLQLVDQGVLLRRLPNPLTPAEQARLRDARRSAIHPDARAAARAATSLLPRRAGRRQATHPRRHRPCRTYAHR